MKKDPKKQSENPSLIELLRAYSSTSELDLSNTFYIEIGVIEDAFKINSKLKHLIYRKAILTGHSVFS